MSAVAFCTGEYLGLGPWGLRMIKGSTIASSRTTRRRRQGHIYYYYPRPRSCTTSAAPTGRGWNDKMPTCWSRRKTRTRPTRRPTAKQVRRRTATWGRTSGRLMQTSLSLIDARSLLPLLAALLPRRRWLRRPRWRRPASDAIDRSIRIRAGAALCGTLRFFVGRDLLPTESQRAQSTAARLAASKKGVPNDWLLAVSSWPAGPTSLTSAALLAKMATATRSSSAFPLLFFLRRLHAALCALCDSVVRRKSGTLPDASSSHQRATKLVHL